MSFLTALKTGTEECHRDLEKSLDIVQRVKTGNDYRALLVRFFTLYEPLENALDQSVSWGDMGWDFSARRKTPWLQEDLRALGVLDAEMAGWPRCDVRSIPDSQAAAVGCVYVLEGSTLGGQILSRQFSESLGIEPGRGGRFFRGYGEATVSQWRAFGAWAEARAAMADPAWKDSAVSGARKTFDAFSRWLMS